MESPKPENEISPEQVAPLRIEATSGSEILTLFGEEVKAHYEPQTVQVLLPEGGYKLLTLHVARLSPISEATLKSRIERRNNATRGAGGSEIAYTNASGLTIAETVHLRIEEAGETRYVKMFTPDQILGRAERKNGQKVVQERVIGLYDHSSVEAIAFANALAAAAFHINPSMNPALEKIAEQALAIQFALISND